MSEIAVNYGGVVYKLKRHMRDDRVRSIIVTMSTVHTHVYASVGLDDRPQIPSSKSLIPQSGPGTFFINTQPNNSTVALNFESSALWELTVGKAG